MTIPHSGALKTQDKCHRPRKPFRGRDRASGGLNTASIDWLLVGDRTEVRHACRELRAGYHAAHSLGPKSKVEIKSLRKEPL
jgi:hypothetical protein